MNPASLSHRFRLIPRNPGFLLFPLSSSFGLTTHMEAVNVLTDSIFSNEVGKWSGLVPLSPKPQRSRGAVINYHELIPQLIAC